MNHYGCDCPGETSLSHSDISSVSDIAASVLSGEVLGRAAWSFSTSTSDSHILGSDSGEVWQQSFSVEDQNDTNKNNCILKYSLCFSCKKKLPNNVLEESVVIPSKFETFNPDYYKFHSTADNSQEASQRMKEHKDGENVLLGCP